MNHDVTRILSAIERGEPHASDQLLPLVYEELRKLAAQKLALERPGQTLQATALVHEAYLRLVDREVIARWDGARALLRRGRRSDAPNPRRECPTEADREMGRADRDSRSRWPGADRQSSPPKTCSPWTRRSRSSRPKSRTRPHSSSFATSPACPSPTSRRSSASRGRRRIAIGRYARTWLFCELASPTEMSDPSNELHGFLSQSRAHFYSWML